MLFFHAENKEEQTIYSEVKRKEPATAVSSRSQKYCEYILLYILSSCVLRSNISRCQQNKLSLQEEISKGGYRIEANHYNQPKMDSSGQPIQGRGLPQYVSKYKN